ncbi:MAG: threonine/serine exporter family protein [Acetobacteraceae bacterium]
MPFAAALLSGVIGAAGVLLGASGTAALCLVTPGMIIVPGVPLINGVQDMIENHMTVGLSRLGAAGLVTMAIALGPVSRDRGDGGDDPSQCARGACPRRGGCGVFGAGKPWGSPACSMSRHALPGPASSCGVASHTTRTLCTHLGIDIVSGTLIGALLVGFIAQGFARAFDAPAVAFAFPGVVAMVPGVYAFRAAIGSLQIVSAGSAASPALIAETLSLGIAGLLMVTMIAIGVVAPLILFVRGPARPGGSR